MLRGIAFARERNVPFLGTCAGFQYALIEFTRNVLGVLDADSAENHSGGANIVITPVHCPVPAAGGPRLAGAGTARPVPGTLFARVCGTDDLRGEYFCSFETNSAFVSRWQAAGLRVAAHGSDGEMRAFELPGLRFFVATLFQPQLSSSFQRPHPIIQGYLRACMGEAAA
jgi:CTP synthase (UTP-ammonia lyase)